MVKPTATTTTASDDDNADTAILLSALASPSAPGSDAAAAGALRRLGAAGSLATLPTTFDQLAALGLPAAAVQLARVESGGGGCGGGSGGDGCNGDAAMSLAEEEATPEGGGYLHAAAAAGAGRAVVAALLGAGCALAHADAAGDTPLHIAAAAGRLETCRALVEAGADPLARNSRTGRTARAQAGGKEAAVVNAYLAEAEAERRRQAAALWDAKMRATQTASACRLGCL